MGGAVLSWRAMARLWARVALAALVALAAAESDPKLLREGEKALCKASHSRWARTMPRTGSNADPKLPGSVKPPGYNVFLVFEVRPCSGVLVSGTYAVTSQYCTEHRHNGTAFAGGMKYQSRNDLTHPLVQIAIVNSIVPYNSSDTYLDHDVAVVHFHKNIEQNSRISYATLTSISRWQEAKPGVFMGFGETFEGDSAHELRSGEVVLDCGMTCAPDVPTYNLGENALCGYNTSFSMCWGDMGGAVVDAKDGTLVGLVAYKTMKMPTYRLCTDPPINTFFMFIGYYRDWILSMTNLQDED